MDDSIIAKMRTFKEFKDKSVTDIKALIKRGHEIKAEDQKALDEQGILRSHYHLSEADKDALATASQYDIMAMPLDDEEDDYPFDEEE